MKAIECIKLIFKTASWSFEESESKGNYKVELDNLSIAFTPITDTIFTIEGEITTLSGYETEDFELLKELGKLCVSIILQRSIRIVLQGSKVVAELEFDANIDEDLILDDVGSFLDVCDIFKEQATKMQLEKQIYTSSPWSLLR